MILLTLLACLQKSEPDDDLATDARVDGLETRLADAEARLADTEARLVAAEAALAATGEDVVDHEARIVEMETHADAVDEDLLTLSGNLFANDLRDQEQDAAIAELTDALAGLGGGADGGLTMATSSQAYNSIYNVGSSATWMSVVSDLTLTLDAARPVVAWCTATSNASYAMFRVRIESADRAWSSVGEEVNDGSGFNNYWDYVDETFTAMGAFTAPAPGEYIVSCEANGNNGVLNINFVALAG